MQREYIRLPKREILPDSSKKKRALTDDFWINLIHYHLLKFFKEYDRNELKALIASEKAKLSRKHIEDDIKDYMKKWFETYDKQIFRQGLLINLESKVKYNQTGFYDIKFQHSDWVDGDNKVSKYYPFECKNLNSKKASFDEYVFNKAKTDGGIYRYFNGKYAQKQDFGGMLGFVLEGNRTNAMTRVISSINSTFNTLSEGTLIKNGIQLNSIENNEFTFSSIHQRGTTQCKLVILNRI